MAGCWLGADVDEERESRGLFAKRRPQPDTLASAGGDRGDISGVHHHSARIPASGRRNLLDLLLEEPNKVNCNL